MVLPLNLEEITRLLTLDRGRTISNDNDVKLAQRIIAQLSPSIVHRQDVADTVWVVRHGLNSNYIEAVVRNPFGERIYPAKEQAITTDILLVTFSAARSGTCTVSLLKEDSGPAALQQIGLPSDGSWEDGAVLLQSTDSIVDALDRLNEFMASVFIPPSLLDGELQFDFGGSGSFHSAYLSAGVSQNFDDLTAGTTSDYVTLTNAISVRQGSNPLYQFGRADKGVLTFYRNATALDSVNLETYFDETKRSTVQSWPSIHGVGNNGILQVLEVTCFSNVPTFQKGSFAALGSAFLTPGENTLLHATHEHDLVTSSTDSRSIFYDDGVAPTINPTFLNLYTKTFNPTGKYLDGILHFGLTDSVELALQATDVYNRTFSSNLYRIVVPGIQQGIDIAHNSLSVAYARPGQFASDDFFDESLNTDLWTVVDGAFLEESGKIKCSEAVTGVGGTHLLQGAPKVLFAQADMGISVKIAFQTDVGDAGYEFGLKLDCDRGTGAVWLVYRRSDADAALVEVYYKDHGGSRISAASVPVTALVFGDYIHFKINTTIPNPDRYIFKYGINTTPTTTILCTPLVGDGPDVGYLPFKNWTANGETDKLLPLNYYLYASNELSVNKGKFNLSFDDFAAEGGEFTVPKAIYPVPNYDDLSCLLYKELIFDQAGIYSSKGSITASVISPRGTVAGVLTSLPKIMVNTVAATSTSLIEDFDDNAYRLVQGDYDVPPVGGDAWDDTIPLGLDDAQVTNSKLICPNADFYTGVLPVQDPAVDYSSFPRTGVCYYYRKFPVEKLNGGQLKFTGSLTEFFVGLADLWIKIPTVTGWLYPLVSYNAGTFTGADADGIQTGINQTLGTIDFTFGSFDTGTSLDPSGGVAIIVLGIKRGFGVALEQMKLQSLILNP